MNDLVQEPNQLSIIIDAASREYQCTLDETSHGEETILGSIQQRRQQQNTQFANNIQDNRRNPIRCGDTVRITNEYRADKKGAVEIVTRVTN